jgi:large subunit ribosomal protein L24
MAVRIKKNDLVEVIAGDHRGLRGKVLRVDAAAGKLVVQGINRAHKHVRPSRRTPQGGRIEIEQPLDLSNVMVVNPKTDRPTRVRFVTDEKGQKQRVAADGTVLDTVRYSRS